MAFCANCGAEMQGRFCPNCGAAATAGPAADPSGSSSYVPPPPPPPPYSAPAAAGLTENVASALCYLLGLVTGIIFLVVAPYNTNRTIRFHAFQSIFGHIALFVVWILYAIVSAMLVFITHGVGLILYPLFMLGTICLWLYLMYSAYNNKKVKLPVVGDLAEKQA